jgi:hypothetical protein
MKNPLIVATDGILAHLDTLQAGSTVSEQFISEHREFVENLRRLIDTYLIEAYHAEEGHKAQTNAYNELRAKLDELQTKPKTS